MTIGAKLKELRVDKRESLQQVADAVGASKAHIWELETGRSANPSIQLVTKLADHFQTSVASLVGEKPEDLDDEEAAFFRSFSGLTPEVRKVLMDLAQKIKS